MNAPIDLSRLAAPDVVEAIDFEVILAERKARYVSYFPTDQQAEVAKTLQLESEPVVKLIQESAYREVVLRQRINDAARARMLAFAKRNDLEHVGALFDVYRLTIRPADPTTNTVAVMEDDESLRERIQLAPQGFSVAGPRAAYIRHARAVDGRVLDVSVSRPLPGDILITILSREGSGVAPPDLCNAVQAALSDERVRPLNDTVFTTSAEIIDYEVHARLRTFRDFDAGIVLAEARKSLDAYIARTHRLGREVTLSGLYAALHIEGVERVTLLSPATDIAVSIRQASHCTAVLVEPDGIYG